MRVLSALLNTLTLRNALTFRNTLDTLALRSTLVFFKLVYDIAHKTRKIMSGRYAFFGWLRAWNARRTETKAFFTMLRAIFDALLRRGAAAKFRNRKFYIKMEKMQKLKMQTQK